MQWLYSTKIVWYFKDIPGLHISLRTEHDTATLHHSYLSTLQWAVDTADLDVAMFSPGDDLQSLKVTAQNHHITTWRVGLSRDKETARRGERWKWHSNPPRENCMKGHLNCTCPGASVTASNMPPYDSSGVQAEKLRILCSISVALRSRSSHEQWLTVTVSPSQEDRTEIVILLIHSLNSMGVVSHRGYFEITECKSSQRYCLCTSDMQHRPKTKARASCSRGKCFCTIKYDLIIQQLT